jgi:hypothetical protein
MGGDAFCHVLRAAGGASILLALALGLGCHATEDGQAPDKVDSEERSGRLGEIYSMKPGEEISYSIAARKPVQIGILCVDAPVGGLVQVSQQGSVSQASTEFWISRVWMPTGEGLHLKVTNNATNNVRVILFEGEDPPPGY